MVTERSISKYITNTKTGNRYWLTPTLIYKYSFIQIKRKSVDLRLDSLIEITAVYN